MKLSGYTWGTEAYAGVVIPGYNRSLAKYQAAWDELQPLFPETQLIEVEINISSMDGQDGFPALLFPTHGVPVPADFRRIQSNQFRTYH